MNMMLVFGMFFALAAWWTGIAFAAANPFSDVPADHWAYEAVTQLAAEGVIEGYGDSTFRGGRSITRYEMAQMVARAMARNDVSAADKAVIDKLAAEFADELGSLGVRVAGLERNADLVRWNGKLEYKYTRLEEKNGDGTREKEKYDELLLRLEPSAEINEHWQVHGRIDTYLDMSEDKNIDGYDFRLRRAWAQGDYKHISLRFGRFNMYGDDSINDTTMSGADVTVGSADKLSGVIGGGRSAWAFEFLDGDEPNDVFYAGVDYNKAKNKGVFGAARYFRYTNDTRLIDGDAEAKRNNIWQLMAGYKFDENSTLQGYYAKSDRDIAGWEGNSRSYNIEFDYKGAQQENKGTWGAWVAYRHAGLTATPYGTWDVIYDWTKGWDIGVNYTLMKNMVGTLRYGDGRLIGKDEDKVRQFMGRLEFFF